MNMAVIKKTELDAMNDAQKEAKIAELERAILELRGEGKGDKARPLRKAIAMLRTPRPLKTKKRQL
jgi:hypothetical protein